MWQVVTWYTKIHLEIVSKTRPLIEFLVGTLPIVVFYLFYFYPAQRFYLPTMVLLMSLAGAILGFWFKKIFPSCMGIALVLIFVGVGAIIYRSTIRSLPPYARMTADQINTLTPSHAWIVSALPPAYIEYLVCRNSKRRVVPISRSVEYADKLIAYEKVVNPTPPPKHCYDHRCAGLLNGGAKEAVLFVATEQFQQLADEVRKGTAVFLATPYLSQADAKIVKRIRDAFDLVCISPWIYQLKPKPNSDGTLPLPK
jgi:hypothetical protein